LRQRVGTPLQEIDRIAVAQDFDSIPLAQFIQPSWRAGDAGLPIHGAGANSVLDGWPVFFLSGRQLEGSLDDIIRMSVKVPKSAALGVAAAAGVRA